MWPALLLLALLGPAAARRHAPALREDEPARRTTRPAGECQRYHPTLPPQLNAHRSTATADARRIAASASIFCLMRRDLERGA